tara:strand:+ start:4065 stop:4631 length:567 start_codon:yes stop_codon:yes gene_type:complete
MNLKNFSIFLIYSILVFSYSKVMAYEETQYKILQKTSIYEIRDYPDRLAVQTTNYDGNSSFRKLFNYISGKNKSNEKIQMTTPVTEVEKEGYMTMQFYLPSKFNKGNAPNPSRPDVQIVIIEGGHYAVIRYSGRASESNFIKHKKILEEELKKNNILILSPAIKATYDGPFTLPMKRRNEAMFLVNRK